MTYKEFLVWSEDIIKNPMDQLEYLEYRKKELIKVV